MDIWRKPFLRRSFSKMTVLKRKRFPERFYLKLWCPPQERSSSAQSSWKGQRRLSQCFTRSVCFGVSRGKPLFSPPPQIPLSVGQSYLHRSGSEHPTETARSEDSEMRWREIQDHPSSSCQVSKLPGWKPYGWWAHMWDGDWKDIKYTQKEKAFLKG